MFTKIAVPLDGSRLAEKALPFAVTLAARSGAQVLLLRVVDTFPLIDTVDKELDSLFVAEAYLKDVRAIITDPTAPLSLPEDRVQILALYGNPAKVVAEIVPCENADVIVMATHGRSGLSRMVTGSVATRIIHDCGRPVILIHPDTMKNTRLLAEEMRDPAVIEQDHAKTLLVTLDGTARSEAILAPAVSLAQSLHLSMTLLHVIIPADYNVAIEAEPSDMQHSSTDVEQDMYAYLMQKQAAIREKGVACTSTLLSGMPVAGTIADYARASNALVVAIATHHQRRSGRVALGSVADALLHKSHIPLLQVWSDVSDTHAPVEAETVTA